MSMPILIDNPATNDPMKNPALATKSVGFLPYISLSFPQMGAAAEVPRR